MMGPTNHSCEREEYTFMVLREYLIIFRYYGSIVFSIYIYIYIYIPITKKKKKKLIKE